MNEKYYPKARVVQLLKVDGEPGLSSLGNVLLLCEDGSIWRWNSAREDWEMLLEKWPYTY